MDAVSWYCRAWVRRSSRLTAAHDFSDHAPFGKADRCHPPEAELAQRLLPRETISYPLTVSIEMRCRLRALKGSLISVGKVCQLGRWPSAAS